MSRPYVAQDEHGGWYADVGGVMQDGDPTRTREQALEFAFERHALVIRLRAALEVSTDG